MASGGLMGKISDDPEFIYMTDSTLKYINKNHKKVTAKMYDYKCDIKLKVGDAKFKAHKDVLSEASDYFGAMFSVDMREREQKEIEIFEISPDGFSALLDYFYHGRVSISPDNIEDVIEAARFLHVDWILEVSCDFLVRHLSLENYDTVLHLADFYSLGDLRWDISRFLGENLTTLIEEPRFYQNLSFELLLNFLKENIYVEMSEGYILKIVLDWVHENYDARQKYLPRLLEHVRMGMLELEELDRLPDEVLDIPEVSKEVDEARRYICSITTQSLYTSKKYLPRGSRKVLTIMAASEEANGTIVLYRDAKTPGICQEELSPRGLDTEVEFTSQATIGNFLYIAGGYDHQYCSSNRLFRFDPRYRDWVELTPLLQKRVSFAMCSSDTALFAIGGIHHMIHGEVDEEIILSSVEMYEPEENCWKPLSPLPHGSYDQAAAFVSGSLYVSGGISSDPVDPVPLNYFYRLKVDGGTWQPLPSMLHNRQGHSMTPVNGKLIVIGGRTAHDVATISDCLANEMYDLATHQWTEITPTPPDIGHIFRYVDMLDGKIAFLASHDGHQYIYFYDTEKGKMEPGDYCGREYTRVTTLQVSYPSAQI